MYAVMVWILSSGFIVRLGVAPAASVTAIVSPIAREIASKAPLAVYGCKRLINYSRDHSTADALDYISIWNASMLHVEEIGEAMTANKEKREGNVVELPPARRQGIEIS